MISSQPLPLSPVMIDTDEGPDASDVNPLLGLEIKDDGSVIIDLNPPELDKSKEEFDENLALQMDGDALGKLAEDLIQGIEADIQSRSEWEATRARGLDLLALKLEQPRANVNSSSAPIEGMSTVRHPLLLEAVLRHQANASGELLPADGPAKIRNDGAETIDTDKQAEKLEKDFNHYLTKTATEYYPDTRRTLFWSGFGGSGFKKLYHCPIRRRPVSESIDANDLIVSDAATDLANAPRVTHRIRMAPSIMRRMQIVGAYRDVSLGQPQPLQNPVDLKKESIEGVKARQDRPEDQPYTLYECYCEVVLDEFAPKQFKGKELPLPFKITIDKDSREILEVRRFWDEDDEQCMRKKRIVKYPYVEGMGLYGIGLVHILGNSTNALTAAWREALDAGMYASFPGFIYNKSAGRQLSNEFRVPPGGGVGLDAAGGDIRAAVMPIPYKDVTPGLMAMIDKVTQACQSVGGTAELPVGEGKQDAPVGTTLALIEQSTKVESAVHKGLHQAQSEEFEIFLELFREDPEAFWRHNPKNKDRWDTATLLQALDNCKLVPVADPNTPSHLHRIAKALAIKQLQAANPSLYDPKKVDERILAMIKVDDADNLFAPPAPPQDPPPDPLMVSAQAKMIQAQTGAQKVALEAQNKAENNQEKAAQRASDEKIAQTKLATELVIHQDDQALKRDGHKLNISKHGLAATQAAHAAIRDVQKTINPTIPQG